MYQELLVSSKLFNIYLCASGSQKFSQVLAEVPIQTKLSIQANLNMQSIKDQEEVCQTALPNCEISANKSEWDFCMVVLIKYIQPHQ